MTANSSTPLFSSAARNIEYASSTRTVGRSPGGARTRGCHLRWLAILAASLSLCPTQASSGTLWLLWDKSASAASYRVYQTNAGTISLTLSGLTATQAAVNGVATNVPSQWFVTALNGQGAESRPSNVLTYTPGQTPVPVPPTAPTQLTGQFVTAKRIDVAWVSDRSAVTEVERSVNAGPFVRIGEAPPGTMHFSDNGAWKKDRQSYRLRCRNTAGASPYSATFTVPPQ